MQSPPPKRRRVQRLQDPSEDSDDAISHDTRSAFAPDNPTGKQVRWKAEGSTVAEDDDSDSTDTNHKTCLATWNVYGRTGCALYDPHKCVLFLLEDTEEWSPYDLTSMLLEQLSPDIIITSSKAEETFIDELRDCMDERGGFFQIRPHKEFTATRGRSRLLSLRLLSDLPFDPSDESSGNTSTTNRNAYDFMRARKQSAGDPTLQKWNALIRVSNYAFVESAPLCLASIGALLDYLVRERVVNDLDEEGVGGIEVSRIELIALNEVMQINGDAILSLQIFENESHASIHSDKTKEGLSLFGTLDNTKTTLGRSLLRTWLLRPSLSLDTIRARHDAVACFSHPENIGMADLIHGHLNGMKNVPRILAMLKTGHGKLSDWQGLVKFSFHGAMIRDCLSELHSAMQIEFVRKLVSALEGVKFKEVGMRINDVIDWEESIETGRTCVRRNIDEDLDNRKHVYSGIDDVLSKVAEQIADSAPQFSSLNVVYFPQLGFLICVPMLLEWQSEGQIQGINGWSFQFSSNANVYFKSQEMNDMDTHIGDLHSAIVDREIEIVHALLEELLVYEDPIVHACQVSAELDCLLSFAQASRLNNYRRPTMVEQNVIEINNGRHPLQEQVVDTFVPNSARIVGGRGEQTVDAMEDDKSILLCTGANACGKSVYLKQIALIQIMAQIGCFVPAESAMLGLVDKIFTRISTRESVSRVQSAFMIDLNQVSVALRNCTKYSLILLDEFGKGTLATDGAGLFCGVLRHLLKRGHDCPKVLVATHFHDVFRKDLIDPHAVPISFCRMQIMFKSADGFVLDSEESSETEQDVAHSSLPRPSENITYLYRVARGLSLDSHAAQCAALFGLPARVVQRASYVSHLVSSHQVGTLLDEDMSAKEREDLEEAEAVCRRFLAWDFDAIEPMVSVKERLATCLGMDDEVVS